MGEACGADAVGRGLAVEGLALAERDVAEDEGVGDGPGPVELDPDPPDGRVGGEGADREERRGQEQAGEAGGGAGH